MQTLTEIKAHLDEAGLSPKKSLGQNFLHDQNLIRKLIDASDPAPGELVLEVGPGTGALTEALLERGAEVIAVELDDGLYALNQRRLGDRMTIIHGDALPDGSLHHTAREAIAGRPFRMIANLPYQVASPLMVHLARDPTCLGQYVMIQREVAQRLRASIGTKDYSELTVMVRATSDVSKIAAAPPGCFWPPPKVVSELVAIVPRNDRPDADTLDRLERLASKLFQQRRKQIGSVLGRDLDWPEGVSPTARPEALTVEQLIALSGIAEL